MDYYKGYGYTIANYGSHFKFVVTLKGQIVHEGYSKTANGAVKAMRKIVSMFVG
jgi:hypothetical protein